MILLVGESHPIAECPPSRAGWTSRRASDEARGVAIFGAVHGRMRRIGELEVAGELKWAGLGRLLLANAEPSHHILALISLHRNWPPRRHRRAVALMKSRRRTTSPKAQDYTDYGLQRADYSGICE
jgi:hypothetical protein